MNFFSNCCFVKIMEQNLRYSIYNLHIANFAICILDVRDVLSGDVSVTVSTKFFGKKSVKDQNSVPCTKKKSYFWFPQGMIIFPGGVRQKWNFRRGGGFRFGSQFLENPEERGGGVIGKIPSLGGMDIFWKYTFLLLKGKSNLDQAQY